MKEISSIPKDIYDAMENASPKFLICGIRKQQGQNGQPSYSNVYIVPQDEDKLMKAVQNCHRFKVFSIGLPYSYESEIKNKSDKWAAEQVEQAERKQYEMLRRKFETKLELV